MNPSLAPRAASCVVCREVAAVEHVAMLMFSEDGSHLPLKAAASYIRSIGMAGSPQTLHNRALSHRRHIDAWIGRGGAVAPMDLESGISRVPAPAGPVRWLDAQQNAIDLGNEALRDLAARLSAGALESGEVISLAKLGVSAANTRGSMEQKGKALNGIDRLLQLAAGGVDIAGDD